jgi:hypothetical protein
MKKIPPLAIKIDMSGKQAFNTSKKLAKYTVNVITYLCNIAAYCCCCKRCCIFMCSCIIGTTGDAVVAVDALAACKLIITHLLKSYKIKHLQ